MNQIISIILSLSMVFSFFIPPKTEQVKRLESKKETIELTYNELVELNEQVELDTYDLITLQNKLNEVNETIEKIDNEIVQTTKDLAQAKWKLSVLIKDAYKNRFELPAIQTVLEAVDFEDFISRLKYFKNIIQYEKDLIDDIQTLYFKLTQQKTKLEANKKKLKELITQQEQYIQSTQQSIDEIQDYTDEMDENNKQEINQYDQDERIEIAEQTQETLEQLQESPDTNPEQLEDIAQAIEQTQEYINNVETQETPQSNLIQEIESPIEEIIESKVEEISQVITPIEESSTEESIPIEDQNQQTENISNQQIENNNVPSDFLSRAYSILGAGYQWSGYNWTGDISNSAFTCSGVVDYALGRPTNSSSPESLYGEVGSNITTNVNELQAGDLVFYSYGGRQVGHVGIYVGDGQVLDSIPNGGVALRDVSYMDVVGGGSL